MIDLPLQDDEQEEQPQQDVPQVAEDVVEGARRDKTGLAETRTLEPFLFSQQASQSPALSTLATPGPQHNPHLRLPSGWAQRKL